MKLSTWLLIASVLFVIMSLIANSALQADPDTKAYEFIIFLVLIFLTGFEAGNTK